MPRKSGWGNVMSRSSCSCGHLPSRCIARYVVKSCAYPLRKVIRHLLRKVKTTFIAHKGRRKSNFIVACISTPPSTTRESLYLSISSWSGACVGCGIRLCMHRLCCCSVRNITGSLGGHISREAGAVVCEGLDNSLLVDNLFEHVSSDLLHVRGDTYRSNNRIVFGYHWALALRGEGSGLWAVSVTLALDFNARSIHPASLVGQTVRRIASMATDV
jgi:hypothetical protein